MYFDPCTDCVRPECEGCRLIEAEKERTNRTIEINELRERIKELKKKLMEVNDD
jgi:hypothetical protein